MFYILSTPEMRSDIGTRLLHTYPTPEMRRDIDTIPYNTSTHEMRSDIGTRLLHALHLHYNIPHP